MFATFLRKMKTTNVLTIDADVMLTGVYLFKRNVDLSMKNDKPVSRTIDSLLALIIQLPTSKLSKVIVTLQIYRV